jgi:two-component system, OmpR family, sensor kinase
MNRIFIQAYAFIIITVLGVAWGTDFLWQTISKEYEQTQAIEEKLLKLAEFQLLQQPEHLWPEYIEKSFKLTGLKFELIASDQIEGSSFFSKLNHNNWVQVLADNQQLISYKKLAGHDYILSYTSSNNDAEKNNLELWFILAFYISIAIILFFWTWPLSKDLKNLEDMVGKLGHGNWKTRLNISRQSPVYPLTNILNLMASRINDLISSHKELTNVVSHELRTPLARVKFALEIAKSNPDDREVIANNIESISEDTAEMDTLVNELLSYAEFEHNEFELHCEWGNLNSVISQHIQQIKNTADNQYLNIEFKQNNNNEDIYCDGHFMERAFQNLFLNASRFSKSKIFVSLDVSNDLYCISVEDDGPGVDIDDREHIFESFFKSKRDQKSGKSNYGLGLSIVKRIAQWHNGDVSIEQSSLGGAKFTIYWPRKS